MSKAGLVYILKNECMPGIVKVGRTNRTAMERANELFTTGVPVPFEVVFAIYSADVVAFEAEVHAELQQYRIVGNREFFRIDTEECVRIVMQSYSTEYMEGLQIVAADFIVSEHDVNVYAWRYGVHACQVSHVIEHISDAAWHEAIEKYTVEFERRVSQQKQPQQRLTVSAGVENDATFEAAIKACFSAQQSAG